MSTRSNIKVTDGHNEMWLYRHSDGYPQGALPPLLKFLDWCQRGLIRDNISQSAGWLVVLGHIEYSEPDRFIPKGLSAAGEPLDWKVGSIEPTFGQHLDIEFLYHIDLTEKKIDCYKVDSLDGDKLQHFATITDPTTDPNQVEPAAA